MGVGFCSPSMHLVVPLGDCCIRPKYFGAVFLVLSFIKCSLVLPIKEKKKKKTLFAFCYGVIKFVFFWTSFLSKFFSPKKPLCELTHCQKPFCYIFFKANFQTLQFLLKHKTSAEQLTKALCFQHIFESEWHLALF